MNIALTIPAARRSSLTLPRRDLVLSAGETCTLQVTLVTSDRPGAAPLDLSGLGPRLVWQLWRKAQTCDYGMTPFGTELVAAVEATFPDAVNGRADLTIARGVLGAGTAWHTLLLDYGGALSAVACGTVQVQPGPMLPEVVDLITDDNNSPLEV